MKRRDLLKAIFPLSIASVIPSYATSSQIPNQPYSLVKFKESPLSHKSIADYRWFFEFTTIREDINSLTVDIPGLDDYVMVPMYRIGMSVDSKSVKTLEKRGSTLLHAGHNRKVVTDMENTIATVLSDIGTRHINDPIWDKSLDHFINSSSYIRKLVDLSKFDTALYREFGIPPVWEILIPGAKPGKVYRCAYTEATEGANMFSTEKIGIVIFNDSMYARPLTAGVNNA